jgi:ABC-type sugar transport system substrate-binding protein
MKPFQVALAAAPFALAAALVPAYASDKPVQVTIGWASPDVSGVFKTRPISSRRELLKPARISSAAKAV